MKTYKHKFLPSVLVPVFLLASCQTFAEASDSPLTPQKIDEVWNANYEYGSQRMDAFLQVIKNVGMYAASANGETVAALEESVLSKVFSMRVGTLEDRQEGRESRCHIQAVESYLVAISRWASMRTDRNLFLRVADNVARYKYLPDLNQTDAKRLASRIDDYLKYGTNKPPFKAGITRPWDGPMTEHVYKTALFRELYNRSVRDMRQRIFRIYKGVLFEDGFKDFNDEERQQLWQEFVLRAGTEP